jgi:hypothetical protein
MKKLHETDQKTMAWINLYGVLGLLEELCRIDGEAQKLTADAYVSIGFAVKNGPEGTLSFSGGTCTLLKDVSSCMIKLPFSSSEKFNGMIDGTVTPFPSKGFFKLGFLLHTFTKLTDILSSYLKPAEEQLKNRQFFETSTTFMLYLVAVAVAECGNHDSIGKFSAGYIPDGTICLAVKDGPAAAIVCRDHTLTAVKSRPAEWTALMEFDSMETARGLFDGSANAMDCIGSGSIRCAGLMSMIDNMNRILTRVGLYLG